MTKLFYIMESSVAPLCELQPVYTPLTNHKTDSHTVPLVLLSEYRKLIEIIEDIKQWDISSHNPRIKIPHLTRIDMQSAILDYERMEKELLL